jgi:hypothetical protein
MTLTVETWCEALESGKHKQAKERLRRGDAFCCLGLACHISGAGKWDKGEEYHIAGETAASEFLPDALERSLGLATDSGWFAFDSLPPELQAEICRCAPPCRSSLIGLNDAGVPFPLIAKVIRARPKGLFREDDQS